MKHTLAMVLLLASSTLLAQMPAAGGMSSAVVAQRTPYYVDPLLLDLSTVLPLPPTQGSETTERELAYVHTIEQTRTPEQVAQAQQDDKEEDLFIFSNLIGPRFTKADLKAFARPWAARRWAMCRPLPSRRWCHRRCSNS